MHVMMQHMAFALSDCIVLQVISRLRAGKLQCLLTLPVKRPHDTMLQVGTCSTRLDDLGTLTC